jgi:heme-degrading monooxygenase HmoA
MTVPTGSYAVIFRSKRTPEGQSQDYADTNARMFELAKSLPGFLGIDSVRGADGTGMSVSYWRSAEDITQWRNHLEHLEAQRLGKEKWYESYSVTICRVERSY